MVVSFFAFTAYAFAQECQPADSSEIHGTIFIEDDPVVQMLDSLVVLRFFSSEQPAFTKSGADNNSTEIPMFSDSIYKLRVQQLNLGTPFEFVYNQDVRNFIELYAVRRRQYTERIMGLMQFYFPMIEEHLDKYSLPLELKYLAIIESALNPVAKSRAGAMGLWQFMPGTGKLYGLNVNNLVDDRCDIYRATDAACRHLRDLYNVYGDWSLVLAAYNAGPGNVNRAIKRAGGNFGYWRVRSFLPRETQGYVPAFIAVSYVMNYYTEHKLNPLQAAISISDIDTVVIRQNLRFDQISEMLSIAPEVVEFLNPAYKKGIINASEENPLVLCLPKKQLAYFINNEEQDYAYKTQKMLLAEQKQTVATTSRQEASVYSHVVRKGENLSMIARQHKLSIESLKAMNKLKSDLIHPGQQLIISTARSGNNAAQSL